MPINITPKQTYVNQTATADIDYQIQMAGRVWAKRAWRQ